MSPPVLPPAATELRQVDPAIWKACSGSSVQIPTVHSRVYYFPQGHVEQSSSPPLLSPLVSSMPLILCRILAVFFLANPETDEVFARVRLEPIGREMFIRSAQSLEPSREQDEEEDAQEVKVASFAKILTPSDANNGGGFSVPRFCADLIFPPLNYHADPPVQTLLVTDIHGVVWDFRHIYRGTPRRHLLTTGWSKFVNHKKLIAGDSVVFMKNQSGELFVGIRRAARSNGDCGRWTCPGIQMGGERVKVEEDNGGEREGFWRNGKGRVSAESVAEAAELAVHGLPFEIVYYPRAGSPDFLVKAEVVEESLNVFWTAGMRVKMAMETEDSSRMTWFQGTVSSASIPNNGPWRGSPWRMLQVTWDEPEVLRNVKRVSPWQVEYVVPTPPLQTAFPPTKRFKVPQNPGLLSDGEGELFPMLGLADTMMGNFNPSLLHFNTFPAGMQGARHYPFHVSSISNFISEDTNRTGTDDFFGNNVGPKLKHVATELNNGSSQSENLSPDSHSSVPSFGSELVGNQGGNSSSKVGISSFQLFGKIIYMKEPVESSFEDVGYTEDDGSKGYKEIDGMNNALDLSLTYPYTKLLDKLDVQCPSASTVEACFL